jgi:hypothetical protein
VLSQQMPGWSFHFIVLKNTLNPGKNQNVFSFLPRTGMGRGFVSFCMWVNTLSAQFPTKKGRKVA